MGGVFELYESVSSPEIKVALQYANCKGFGGIIIVNFVLSDILSGIVIQIIFIV